MFEIEGEFTTAFVFADSEHVSSDTISQIYTLVNHPALTQDIAIMPDAHPSSGSVVGFSMRLGDKVPPQIIGGDIGCGVTAVKLNTATLPLENSKREQEVREVVPMGRNTHSHRDSPSLSSFDFGSASRIYSSFKRKYEDEYNTTLEPPFNFDGYSEEYATGLFKRVGIERSTVESEAGTLGSGNHFVEFGKSAETGDIWCSVHAGSRHLGKAVADYWTDKANQTANGIAWLEGTNSRGYLIDMLFAQQYATWNRSIMLENIQDVLNVREQERILCAHNYIDFEDMVMRKGAIPAREGEVVLIPLNMAEGILLGRGKGNEKYLQTAPHGAGRSLSRSQAKDEISIDEFEEAMDGVYTESVKTSMKNEAPQAYKDAMYIVDEIEPTVELTDHIKPLHNLKGYE